jgi:hypothetical protein
MAEATSEASIPKGKETGIVNKYTISYLSCKFQRK